jgi:hypothetical protein
VVGKVIPGTGIVSLLSFPGDQSVLDVDLPAAGTGTVGTVGGSDDLVMLPALAISILPCAALTGQVTMPAGELSLLLFEELQSV